VKLPPLLWLALLLALVACGRQDEPVDAAGRGERIFRAGCLGCHAVTADGPDALGPNLAGVATRAAANPDGLTAAEWLRRATVQPNAEIAEGYRAGFMPANYEQIYRPDEIDALVAYMLTLE
jgi:cytochrome c